MTCLANDIVMWDGEAKRLHYHIVPTANCSNQTCVITAGSVAHGIIVVYSITSLHDEPTEI